MTELTQPLPEQTPCHATRWRVATFICLVLLAIAAATSMSMMEQFKAQLAHMQVKMKSVPQVKYIAVLQDDKNNPSHLLSFDPQDGYVQIQRLNDVTEGREESLQLWALDESGRPLSLGVITAKIKTAQVPTTDKILSKTTRLAISVENKGGVEPGRQPNLPYLFAGKLIQKAQ